MSSRLSAYARQFLDMMQKPDVDHIDGLSPAISIEQKTTSRNPRSTVGTVTEIYDYMRLLWARVGVPYSPATGLPIESQTVSQMVDRVLALPEGTRLYLLAPIARGRKGEYRKEFAELQKKGFQRLKIDGTFYEIAEAPALDKKFKHDIDVVVDRVVVRPDMSARLADSFETALALSDGIAVVEFADRAPEPPHPDPLPQGRGGLAVPCPRGEESTSGATSSPLPVGRGTGWAERPEAHHLLGEVRLPGLGLHHRGDRAAAVLLQQSLWRLPRLRRARHRAVLRARPRGARRKSEPQSRRHRALGAHLRHLALLPADAGIARPRLSPADDQAVEVAARGLPQRHPLRLRRGRDHFHL